MDEQELRDRETMTERIEGHTGCFHAVWSSWPTEDIAKVLQTLLERTSWKDNVHDVVAMSIAKKHSKF